MHLQLGHGKVLPQTHSRSIYKSEQVFIPLYLRHSVSSFIQIQTQPPFRVKLARVTSPQFLGHVDANDGNADDSAFSDENAVDEIAGCGADRVGEWKGVVDIGLPKWKIKRRFKRSYRSQLHTSLVNSGTLGCVLSTSDVNASR